MVHVFTCFASSTGQTVFNIFHHTQVRMVHGLYMLCFQYRTGWASLQVTHNSNKRLSSSTCCVSGTSSKSQFLLFLSPLICLWGGDQDKLILIYVSICSHIRPVGWDEVAVALSCCVNICLHCRLLRSYPVHGSIFMLVQLSGYCYSYSSSFFHFRYEWTDVTVKRSWLHRWDLYSVSSLSWCHASYTRWFHPVKDAVGSVTTPGHLNTRWTEGKDAREHSSTPLVFIHRSSKRNLSLHASLLLHVVNMLSFQYSKS